MYHYVPDIVNKAALNMALSTVMDSVGLVDVLVANAGFLPEILSLSKASIDYWFNGFDKNVKENFNVLTPFVPVAAPEAAVLKTSTGMTHLPTLLGYSACLKAG